MTDYLESLDELAAAEPEYRNEPEYCSHEWIELSDHEGGYYLKCILCGREG